MAEPWKDSRFDALEKAIAKYKEENEKLKKEIQKLEEDKRMYEIDIANLNDDNEELVQRMNELQLLNTRYENEISAMTELEYSQSTIFEDFDELYDRLIQLQIENDEYVNNIQELQSQNERYRNMMRDICIRPSNLQKIPTYTIRRKYHYPYFIIRSANYHEVLEKSKKSFPNLKEVYKVKYNSENIHELLQRKSNNIHICGEDILLVNYGEQNFVEDLKNFIVTDSNGYFTFSLIKKEEYPYYGSRIQEERLRQTDIEFERKFPDSKIICRLYKIPNSVTLHIRIKEKFPRDVSGNHIKLSNYWAEEEFIRKVKDMAAEPSLSP